MTPILECKGKIEFIYTVHVRNRNRRNDSKYLTNVTMSIFNMKGRNITDECRGCRGRDRMVVGFTTTYTISAYHH